MGIGFVLLILTIVGAVLGAAGSVALLGLTLFLTRGAGRSRRWLLYATAAFPFVCLGWAAAVFVFQAAVNLALHRDIGIGDGFDCPLPNGYALSFIDVTDFGTLYKPSGPVWRTVRENAVHNVCSLQVGERHLVGGVDRHAFEHLIARTIQADSWFLLDTQTGQRTDFSDYGELEIAARRLDVGINLIPIGQIYRKYRFTWFDVFAGIVLIIPPMTGAVLLGAWILRVRRSRTLEVAV